ncbi:MAG: type II secretion system protein [Lachnospiraceae bacterium]|nr:type II secretion system protein [Lachnospiraceae bacterium]
MKKMKNDNKGFTLVELIVVLVILAILAAILVPALLGYIDEAKQKQIVLEGKSVYTAAQAVASELYAKDADPADIAKYAGRITTMADIDTTKVTKVVIGFSEKYVSTAKTHGMWTVNYVAYEKGDDKIYLAGGTWSSEDDTTGTFTTQVLPATNSNGGTNGG